MIDIEDVTARAADHLLRTGLFSAVGDLTEPTSHPGRQLAAAIWPQAMRNVPALSGLNTTSVRIDFWVRLYLPANSTPFGDVDKEMLRAVNVLWNVYSGDFTLDGLVDYVDLLGAHGPALSVAAGYREHGGTKFRVYTILLPLVFADSYEQAP